MPVSTNEQQKAKQPLDALLRHFKCGEGQKFGTIRETKAKRENKWQYSYSEGWLYRFPWVDRLVNQGQEKSSWSIAWSRRAPCNGASRYRLYQGDLADQDFMRTVLRNMQILMWSSTLRLLTGRWVYKQIHWNILTTIQLAWSSSWKSCMNMGYTTSSFLQQVPLTVFRRNSDSWNHSQKPINPYGETSSWKPLCAGPIKPTASEVCASSLP